MKKVETIAEVGFFARCYPVGVLKRVMFREAINVQAGENARLTRDPETGEIVAEKYKEA